MSAPESALLSAPMRKRSHRERGLYGDFTEGIKHICILNQLIESGANRLGFIFLIHFGTETDRVQNESTFKNENERWCDYNLKIP